MELRPLLFSLPNQHLLNSSQLLLYFSFRLLQYSFDLIFFKEQSHSPLNSIQELPLSLLTSKTPEQPNRLRYLLLKFHLSRLRIFPMCVLSTRINEIVQ